MVFGDIFTWTCVVKTERKNDYIIIGVHTEKNNKRKIRICEAVRLRMDHVLRFMSVMRLSTRISIYR